MRGRDTGDSGRGDGSGTVGRGQTRAGCHLGVSAVVECLLHQRRQDVRVAQCGRIVHLPAAVFFTGFGDGPLARTLPPQLRAVLGPAVIEQVRGVASAPSTASIGMTCSSGSSAMPSPPGWRSQPDQTGPRGTLRLVDSVVAVAVCIGLVLPALSVETT